MYNFYSRKCPNSPKCSNCILFVNSNANFVNTDILSLRCVCNWHLCKNAKKWSKFAAKCYFQPSLSLKKMNFYHFKVFYTLSLRYMTIGINGVFIRNQNIFVVIFSFHKYFMKGFNSWQWIACVVWLASKILLDLDLFGSLPIWMENIQYIANYWCFSEKPSVSTIFETLFSIFSFSFSIILGILNNWANNRKSFKYISVHADAFKFLNYQFILVFFSEQVYYLHFAKQISTSCVFLEYYNGTD